MRSAIVLMLAVLFAIVATHPHGNSKPERAPIAALNPTMPLDECYRQLVRGGPWHNTFCDSQDLSHPFSRAPHWSIVNGKWKALS